MPHINDWRSIVVDILYPFLWGIFSWFGGRLLPLFLSGVGTWESTALVVIHWVVVFIAIKRCQGGFKRVNWYQIRNYKTGRTYIDVWFAKGYLFLCIIMTCIYFYGFLVGYYKHF